MPDSNPGLMTIFTEALGRTDPAERAAYLDRACGGDAELRRRVDDLLAAHPGIGRFLEPEGTSAFEPERTANLAAETGTHAPAGATGARNNAPPESRDDGPAAGVVIAGRYTLVEVIGEGGMGSVYLAEQTDPVRRQVALKLIKSGMDSRAVLARFDAERQALALMDHPNIARVFDGGTTGRGQPFFVMELVRGLPLTDYCDRRRLPVQARLELFVQVCQAVQHAHQKGVIHRDLKPGNVLVTEVDGRPTPKVIDFGVAKATEVRLTDMSFADTGAIVGTPAYMSPEQADPSCNDIDTRTDVYALGVILYELLTGSPPIDAKQFKRGAVLEMLRMVREVEPPRPSTKLSTADALPNIAANRNIEPAKLAKLLQGELDWVVMKALEKDRTRRYDTANGFARDIQRYLADEVVEARPPSAGYRMKKFVRRHKGRVLAAGLVLFALLGGIAGTTWGMLRAEARRGEAVQAQQNEADRVIERDAALKAEGERADELRHRLGVSAMVLASSAHFDSRDPELAAERLERVPVNQRGWEWKYLTQATRGGVFTLPGLRQSAFPAEPSAVAFTPDGLRVVIAYNGASSGVVRVWDARTGLLLSELKEKTNYVRSIAFSADGSRMVTLEAQFFTMDASQSTIKVWNARTWALEFELKKPGDAVAAIALSPDGNSLAVAGGRLKVWDLRTKQVTQELDTGKPDPLNSLLGGVAYSPDGKRIMACGLRGNIRVWDAQKGGAAALAPNLPLVGSPTPGLDNPFPTDLNMLCVSFSPDGNRILAGYSNSTAKVLDAASGAVLFELRSRKRLDSAFVFSQGMWPVQNASFSPGGSRIVLAGGSHGADEATVWDARTGVELLALTGHITPVRCAAFSPDGTRIVTASDDGKAKFWNARTGLPRFDIAGDQGAMAVAFDPVSDRMVVAGGRTTIWDVRTETVVREQDSVVGGARCAAYSRDGRRIVVGGGRIADRNYPFPGRATVSDARTGEVVCQIRCDTEYFLDAAFSPDGAWVVTCGFNFELSGQLAIAIKIWDARTGALIRDLAKSDFGGGFTGRMIAFHPTGSKFVTGGTPSTSGDGGAIVGVSNSHATVWDAKTLTPLHVLKGNQLIVHSVAWSGDGARILTGGKKSVQVWDAETGLPLPVELLGHTGDVLCCAFNPDGTRIVTGGADHAVRVWDSRTGAALLELKGHPGEVGQVAFNRDGTRLAAVIGQDEQGDVIVWDAPEPANTPVLRRPSQIDNAFFSPDGSQVLTHEASGSATMWNSRTGAIQFELKTPPGKAVLVSFNADGTRLVTEECVLWKKNFPNFRLEDGPPLRRVLDARTGSELTGVPVPDTIPGQATSPDGRYFAHVDGSRVEFIPLKLDEAEAADRRRRSQPSLWQLRQEFDEARGARDEFAARHFLKLLPVDDRPLREARLAMDRGKKPEAIGWYRKAAELYPRDADLQVALGHLLLEAGRKPEALACYLKAIELDDRFFSIGESLTDPEMGIACLRKAVELHPGRVDVHQNLARYLKKNGRSGEALAALRPTVILDPKNAGLHSELGIFLWDEGKRDEAFASYRIASGLAQGYFRLALLQAWFGRDKELAETREGALKLARPKPDPSKWLLECFVSPSVTARDMEEPLAIVRGNLKVSLHPMNSLWLRLAIGVGEYRAGEYAAANDSLRAAAETSLFPKGPNGGFHPSVRAVANSYRAMALFRLGKKDEAKALLAQVAATIPPVPKDELLNSGETNNVEQLLVWLAFKEANSLIGLDAALPAGKK